MPIPEIVQITGTVIAIISAISAGGFAFAQALRAKYWTDIATEWKEVAAARLEKLNDLMSRFEEQEVKIGELQRRNTQLGGLNLDLQEQVNTLRAHIKNLEIRLGVKDQVKDNTVSIDRT